MTASAAAARLSLLVNKLTAAGVDAADAKAWAVVPDECVAPFKYAYVHPRVGSFKSLSTAKQAHVAASKGTKRLPEQQLQPGVGGGGVGGGVGGVCPSITACAGSAGALRTLASAPWYGEGAAEDAPAVSASVASQLDVILVHVAPGRTVPKAAWHMRGLQQDLGFTVVRRSSAVLDADTGRVVALFLTGNEFPEVAALARKLPTLYERLQDTMRNNGLRPGIRMFGYRWNSQGHCNHACRGNMRTGYYPCSSLASARSVWKGDKGRTRTAVVGSASALCGVERLVSPSMAARRATHAAATGHPGIWPGTSHDACPAPTLGVSRGYTSPPHVDYSFADLAETIAWSSKGVPADSGYCFAVTDAGVAFDLLAHEGTVCIVPGSVMHGTPRLLPGFPGEHAGIGMVVLNKANLLSEEAKADTREIKARLAESGNPFVQRFYVSDPNGVRCEACRRGDRADQLLLCDNCHLGYHGDCCKAAEQKNGEWLCHACARM